MVRQWYDDALERTQKARIGKFSNAEILEAMVEKYPPDWSKAVSMPIPGNSGATRITTVLWDGFSGDHAFAFRAGCDSDDFRGCGSG